MERTIFLVVSQDTSAHTVLHDQVSGEELDEILRIVSKGLSVERVKKSMASSVCGSTASVRLAALAVLL